MAFVEALKPKPGSKHLSILIDVDGKEIQAETRNDEQQKIKYDEIIELLIGAGYYRAKIKGLSEFDKVVGGMTWCIDICNIDLDIDLLFQENSTIGQKISLTEKIVAVLPKMQCPFTIEPHQIQGLDFIHIYPVVEWLVKRSLENRDERGDYLRSYAVHHFHKYYDFPNEKLDPQLINNMFYNIKHLQSKYGPQRKYKRIQEQPKDRKARIESTLFEYGHAPMQVDTDDDEDFIDKVELVDEVRTEELSKCMTSVPEDVRLGSNTITSLVEKQASEVSEVLEKFSSLHIEEGGLKELEKLKEIDKKLTNKKEILEGELSNAKREYDALVKTLEMPISDSDLSLDRLKEIKQLEFLIITADVLKDQEMQFKEQCKEDMLSLQNMLKEAEDSTDKGLEDIKEEVDSMRKELARDRMRLAKVTRAVASVQRLLDQIPSRAELSQYQKRFLELYNQVAAKHRETKQYYTLYNSLNDQHQYLTKELNLLNSIFESYNEAMLSPSAKEQFMKQFETIVDGIKQNKAKVEQKRNEDRDLKEKLKSQLQALIDQQRLYAAALKDFTVECKLNESLVVKIKALAQKKNLIKSS